MKNLGVDILKGYVPFQVFSDARLQYLLNHCLRLYARKGQVLLAPGHLQTHAYFLISGQVKCQNSNEVITAAFPYSLHYKYQKNDTIIALTDCSLFQIEKEILDRFLCWSQVSSYLIQEISCQRQYDEHAEWMQTLLQSNLFNKVSPLNLQKIFSHMMEMPVKNNQRIIKQGDVGDCCYFIRHGSANVTRVMEDESKPVVLAEIGVGRCFGEDALLHETVRNATVSMISDGVLMKLDKRDFLQLLREPHVDGITSSDLDMALQTGAILLDVRTLEEYEYDHLKGAICMPLDLLRIKSRMLDRYKSYVLYCDTDRRSRAASSLLMQHGIRAMALTGGLNAMPEKQYRSLIVR